MAPGARGYCGLPGMQARRVENLAIFREVGAGTEIEMTIPARAAYEQRRGSGRFRVGRMSRTRREHAKEIR